MQAERGKGWKLFKNLFAVCSSSIWDLISRTLVDLQSTDPCEKARALAVSRSALYCRNLVQEGTFGRVYKGTLELAGREQEVIIKTVTGIYIDTGQATIYLDFYSRFDAEKIINFSIFIMYFCSNFRGDTPALATRDKVENRAYLQSITRENFLSRDIFSPFLRNSMNNREKLHNLQKWHRLIKPLCWWWRGRNWQDWCTRT